MRLSALLLTTLIAVAPAAYAQEDTGALVERLDRLERDVNFVQKQVYRGGSTSDGSGAAIPANARQMQMRMTQIDEEIRQIRGLIEQVQFQNKQTATELKKLSDDVDYRLRAIEQKQAAAAETAAATPVVPASETPAEPVKPAAEPAEPKPANYQPETKEKPAEAKEKPAVTGKDFPNSNAHYAAALKLLNDGKYGDAATSFDAFVKKYPNDPLTSNSYYWLGESQYARNDFTRAAESFRKGFESSPDGQKAPDNLYKLAMSLSQIKRKSEACIVLGQVVKKYNDTAARTATKAEAARTTLQCK